MSMWNLIPWSISAISLILVILTYQRNTDKDKKTEIKNEDETIHKIQQDLLAISLKLDQVCTTTTETRTDVKSLSSNLSEIDKRLCVVENEVKDLKVKVGELHD